MIRKEIVDQVCTTIGLNDTTTRTKIGSFAARAHQMLCEAANWKDLLSLYTVAVSANQTEVILPAWADRFLAARYDHTHLLPVDQVFIYATDPQIWDRTGTPTRVAQLPSVATRATPAGGTITLVSSNAADSVSVVIVGERSGEEVRESVTLSGTTPMVSANQYDHIYSLAKPTTAGTVTVSDTGGTLLTLQADETERKHIRLRLLETPSQALTLVVLARRRVPPMTSDSMGAQVRGIDQAWEAFTLASAYEWMRQGDDADAATRKGVAFLDEARINETWRESTAQALVPSQGIGWPGEEMGGYGFTGKGHW